MGKQSLAIFTGKGGVGKSTVAAAYALAQSRNGQRVLLVELGSRSSLGSVFGVDVGYGAKEVEKGLFVARWDGPSCLREYIGYFVKIKAVVNLFFENKVMKSFIRVAPALKELAVMGKLTSGIRQWGPDMPYDLVVLDAYATGHFMAMMNAPRGMAELIKLGPMGVQSQNIHNTLTDKEVCEYFVVSLPEELPTIESLELCQKLQDEFLVTAKIINNKFILNADEISSAVASVEDDFTEYVSALLQRQTKSAATYVENKAEVKTLPLIFEPKSKDVVFQIADYIGKQWMN